MSLSSAEAESGVIGGILLDPDLLDDVVSIISIDDFHSPENKQIFKVMLEFSERGDEVDLVTLGDRLSQLHPENDWFSSLGFLMKNTASSKSTLSYAKKLNEYTVGRAIVAHCSKITQMMMDGSVTLADRIAKAQSQILELDKGAGTGPVIIKEKMKGFVEHVEACFNSEKGFTGIDCGFDNVNERLGGLNRKHLIIIAGRPSMGKSVFALNIGRHIAMNQGHVLCFSLEMSDIDILQRFSADVGNINQTAVSRADFEDLEWAKFSSAVNKISGMTFYLDETENLSAGEIIARSKRMARKVKLSAIIIDHMHLMGGDDDKPTIKFTKISKALKGLAKNLDVPVIALAQLNRSLEMRPNKRPIMSDLRESGSIEQDADAIGLIYRDVVYNEDTEFPYVAEVNWAKVRGGKIGTDYFNAQLQYQRFVEITEPKGYLESEQNYDSGAL